MPELLWLGVHEDMLMQDCDAADMQRMSDRDHRRILLLLADDRTGRGLPPQWKEELLRMQRGGKKCEIEAAYRLRGITEFCRMLVDRMSLHTAI